MPQTPQPQPGGYIFLWRSLYLNGHFQMPPNAFKVFIFLLLRVNHTPMKDCGVGEGWIDYEEIRTYCSEKGRGKMSNATISAALDYLERRGYIRRYREKNGLAQKIRVCNYRKYQAAQGFDGTTCSVSKPPGTSSVSKQVANPCGTSGSGPTCLETEQPQNETKQKQEYSEEEEEVMRMIEWVRWYENEFTLLPPRRDYEDIEAMRARGVTDELIIALLKEALANPRVRVPIMWAKRRISDMLPRGIRTVEDYEKFKRSAESTGNRQTTAQKSPAPHQQQDDDFMRQLKGVLHDQQREGLQ